MPLFIGTVATSTLQLTRMRMTKSSCANAVKKSRDLSNVGKEGDSESVIVEIALLVTVR
jgi:hypothetical protein